MQWKHKNESILILLWSLLYIPYIIFGGLVRDDLGFLTVPLRFTNYLDFQWYMSSFLTMTARPISAILHGLCYWYFGTTTWAYHLVNLTLFCGSVLFFYLALEKIIPSDIAFLSSLFALVYPAASGTLFSSIMMNSNLAGLFWSGALLVATKHFKGKNILITFLLLLSSLSYESFIPLFIINILIAIKTQRVDNLNKRLLFGQSTPVLLALILWGVYRKFLEGIIFKTSFSRIIIPPPVELISKFLHSIYLGSKIAFWESNKITIHALNNLGLLSPLYLIIVIISLVIIGVYVYTSITAKNLDTPKDFNLLQRFVEKYTIIRFYNGFPLLDLSLIVILIFLLSHLMYIFSDYLPVSSGFENRTLGAIRFATALVLTVSAKFIFNFFTHNLPKIITTISIIVLLFLYTLSIIGQREAWIGAAQYNNKIIQNINAAIRDENLNNIKSITLVAILPNKFPEEINQEPILGVPWDITPLLSLSNPTISINANVYNSTATAYSDKITINGYWEALYPFWLYDFEKNKMHLITSQSDWHNQVK